MNAQNPNGSFAGRAATALKKRATLVKAVSFALIGIINATINYAVFWVGLSLIQAFSPLAQGVGAIAQASGISAENAGVIVANIVAWSVAVSGSYVMNSLITFAAESGRKLTWRAYFAFAASGLLGLLADTTALLVAKAFLPIMVAKLVSIAAGFVVNFSMSHFVVFRPRQPGAAKS
jgi:putative flippase GtrA